MAVGFLVGLVVGFFDGFLVGFFVGLAVGLVVGFLVGFLLGAAVGVMVGFSVGFLVGCNVTPADGAVPSVLPKRIPSMQRIAKPMIQFVHRLPSDPVRLESILVILYLLHYRKKI